MQQLTNLDLGVSEGEDNKRSRGGLTQIPSPDCEDTLQVDYLRPLGQFPSAKISIPWLRGS